MIPAPLVSSPLTHADDCSPTAELWLKAAAADYRLCREFAQRFDARLARSLRGQRVGWEVFGRVRYALLLPDALLPDQNTDDDWYLYYVAGESLFRRSRQEREKMQMLVLPESSDDWAELLRQSVRDQIFDVRHEIVPDYINALGEVESAPVGYTFTLTAFAPQAVATPPFRVGGAGETPEDAARTACRHWLQEQSTN